jgi:hypothetical protein
MLLLDEERKQMISKLQVINGDIELIDFMRDYFSHDEFADLFNEETEEKIRIAKNRYSYGFNATADYDVRKYTFCRLHKYIPSKYGIDCFYVATKIIKIILFYEHIMRLLDNSNNENAEKNRKIKESKEVYNFYKALITSGKCSLSKYTNAIRILNLTGVTQKELDEDNNRIRHETLANFILDNFLVKFIEDYKNYLVD